MPTGVDHPWHGLTALNLAKLVGPPGSIGFIAFCLLVALIVAYVWPRNRVLARRWLVGVLILHLVLAFPIVANAIAGRLPNVPSADPGTAIRLDTVVVFDGDNRRGRVRQAAALYAKSGARDVLILGGDWMVEPLTEAGVPRSRITNDDRTGTTRSQIARVEALISGPSGARVAVVASRLQIPRVAALTRAAGLHVLLVASPIDTEPPTRGLWLFVPVYSALRVSRDALYEHAALAYYGWQGWTASSP